MGLSGVDTLTCSTLAAQLQASQMEELGALLSELEKRFPKLARRFVVALAGYGAEVSPIGLGTRSEWFELLRQGFCFAWGGQAPAVAAQFSVVAIFGTFLLRSVTISSAVATEIEITDNVPALGPQPGGRNLRNSATAQTTVMHATSAAAVAGIQFKRFFLGANAPITLGPEDILFEGLTGADSLAVWNLTANQALDVSFVWAEPPASWPT